MNEAEVIEIGREAILVMLKMTMPLMLISLIVGVVISLFQAMTQIQEQTITFAPKLLVMFVALLVLLPFMINAITSFTERLMDRISSIN